MYKKEEKSEQNQPPRFHRAGTAQRGALIFYRARADRIFFLAALSPREFRRATEAGSIATGKLLFGLELGNVWKYTGA